MEDLTMSRKEREQVKVLENLKQGLIKQKEAALQLGITTRWVRTGLTHKRVDKADLEKRNDDLGKLDFSA
jgi:hypothetical protein